MKQYKDSLLELIVTCFFIGKIKYAPGTFGSFLAFPLSYAIVSILLHSDFRLNLPYFTFYQANFITVILALISLIVVLFVLGVICSSSYINKTSREDPKEIVIDELVGQMLVIALTSLSVAFMHYEAMDKYINASVIDFVCLFLLPFSLFRFFDIFKPYPINLIDQNIHGGIGVMLDDVLAAIFAVVTQYFIVFVSIDLLHYYNS